MKKNTTKEINRPTAPEVTLDQEKEDSEKNTSQRHPKIINSQDIRNQIFKPEQNNRLVQIPSQQKENNNNYFHSKNNKPERIDSNVNQPVGSFEPNSYNVHINLNYPSQGPYSVLPQVIPHKQNFDSQKLNSNQNFFPHQNQGRYLDYWREYFYRLQQPYTIQNIPNAPSEFLQPPPLQQNFFPYAPNHGHVPEYNTIYSNNPQLTRPCVPDPNNHNRNNFNATNCVSIKNEYSNESPKVVNPPNGIKQNQFLPGFPYYDTKNQNFQSYATHFSSPTYSYNIPPNSQLPNGNTLKSSPNSQYQPHFGPTGNKIQGPLNHNPNVYSTLPLNSYPQKINNNNMNPYNAFYPSQIPVSNPNFQGYSQNNYMTYPVQVSQNPNNPYQDSPFPSNYFNPTKTQPNYYPSAPDSYSPNFNNNAFQHSDANQKQNIPSFDRPDTLKGTDKQNLPFTPVNTPDQINNKIQPQIITATPNNIHSSTTPPNFITEKESPKEPFQTSNGNGKTDLNPIHQTKPFLSTIDVRINDDSSKENVTGLPDDLTVAEALDIISEDKLFPNGFNETSTADKNNEIQEKIDAEYETTTATTTTRVIKPENDFEIFNQESITETKPTKVLRKPYVKIKQTPPNGQVVRLRNGASHLDGYLEMKNTDSKWGLVCDKVAGWGIEEATVACRELGFIRYFFIEFYPYFWIITNFNKSF